MSERNASETVPLGHERTIALPWRGMLVVGGALAALMGWTSLRLVQSRTGLWWTEIGIGAGMASAVVGLLLMLQQRRQAMRGLDPLLADGQRVYLVPALIVLVVLTFAVSLLPLPYPLSWLSTLLPVLLLAVGLWLGYQFVRAAAPRDYTRAQQAYQEGRWAEALVRLRALLEQQPGFYPALHLQSIIHRRQGDCSAAYALAEQLISLRPDLYYGYAELGLTLLEDGQALQACEPLHKAAEIAPSLPEAHLNLGLACTEAENYRDAIAALARALRLGLSDPVMQLMARHALWMAFGALGDRQQAQRELARLRRRRGILRQWRRELQERPGSATSRRKEMSLLAAIEGAIARARG